MIPLHSIVPLLLVLACNGPSSSGTRSPLDPGMAPIARLNNTHYTNIVEDTLDVPLNPDIELPQDNVVDLFDNNVYNISVSQLRADALFDSALSLGDAAATDPQTLLGCENVDNACIDAFILTYGTRLYRHPLTDDEFLQLRQVYDQSDGDTLNVRVGLVVSTMLMAPQFLYRPEVGSDLNADTGIVALTGPEIATRMALLLWVSAPDDALMDEALGGTLSTSVGIEEQAWRMMGDPRAKRGVNAFLRQWIDARKLNKAKKDTGAFPTFSPSLVDSMNVELDAFIDRVVWDEDGSVIQLLTSNQTTVDQALAELYGVSHPGDGSCIDTTLPGTQRSGLLTQGAFLTGKARYLTGSPVRRGKYIREALLCQDIPLPPDDVQASTNERSDAETNRARSEVHLSNPACEGCHSYMDPLGFAFENYDAIGRWRDTDNGFPINATGAVVLGLSEVRFDGAIQLMDALATADQVQQCMAIQAFRYGYGRRPAPDGDAYNLSDLLENNRDNHGSIQSLIVALTLTNGFRYRRTNQALLP